MSLPLVSERGSFGGVSFFLTSFEINNAFHNETLEFITDHPPEPKLYKREAREFSIFGFVIGSSAILERDLLLKLCATGVAQKLFLPSLGFISAVCVSFAIFESDSEPGAINLTFLFKEVQEKLVFQGSELLAKIESYNDLVDSYALKVIGALQVLATTSYGLKRLTDAACKLGAILYSVNGFGLISDTVNSFTHSILEIASLSTAPEKLVNSFKQAFASLTSEQAKKSSIKIALGTGDLSNLSLLFALGKVDDKDSLFFQLIDRLPTEESLRLFKMKSLLLNSHSPSVVTLSKPLPLVIALYKFKKSAEEILKINDNIFSCDRVIL